MKKRFIAVSLSAIMCFSSPLATLVYGAEDTDINAEVTAETQAITITKDEFIEKVMENNTSVEDLETQLDDLLETFTSTKESLDGLETLYDGLDAYFALARQANRTMNDSSGLIEDYKRFLVLNYKAFASGLTSDEVSELNTITLIISDEAYAVNIADDISVAEYIQYKSLQPIYASMGINGTSISNEDEYNMFVYPINITPLIIQNGITALQRGIISAEKAIKDGMGTMYDSALMLDGYVDLSRNSYLTTAHTNDENNVRHRLGLISDKTLETSHNDFYIAMNNWFITKRQYEDLLMNMNVMMQRIPSAELVLEETQLTSDELMAELQEAIEDIELLSLEEYVNEGLIKRNEFLTLEEDLALKAKTFGYIEDFFPRSSEEYKIAEKEYNNALLERNVLEKDITIEITQAYQNLILQEKTYELAIMSYEDALRQYNDVLLNKELGLLTKSTQLQVELLVIQQSESVLQEARNYIDDYEALIDASDI